MELSPQQQAIIQLPKQSLRIIAGPGSGKTRTITERIVHFIETESLPVHKSLPSPFQPRPISNSKNGSFASTLLALQSKSKPFTPSL